jgi:hypothetical protein
MMMGFKFVMLVTLHAISALDLQKAIVSPAN